LSNVRSKVASLMENRLLPIPCRRFVPPTAQPINKGRRGGLPSALDSDTKKHRQWFVAGSFAARVYNFFEGIKKFVDKNEISCKM